MPTQTWPPENRDDVLPLFSIAPQEAPGEHASLVGQRAPVLRRNEFGYDVRMEGGAYGQRHAAHTADYSRLRRLGLLAVVILVLGGVVAFVISQPAVRGLMSGHGSEPVAQAPPTQASAQPTATAAPTDTPAPTETPAPSTPAAAPPPPAAPPQPAGSDVVSFSGSFQSGGDAGTSTTCDNAQTGRASCTWTITVQPGNALFVRTTWSEHAKLSMQITGPDGKTLFDQSAQNGTISTSIAQPPKSVTISVVVVSGDTVHFQLDLANHAF